MSTDDHPEARTRPPTSPRRLVVAVAAASLVGVGLSAALLAGARAAVDRAAAEQAGVVRAHALAEVAARTWAEPPRLRAALAAYTAATGEPARVLAIAPGAAAALAASTWPDGRAPAPRPLQPEEKPAFDRAQRLRGNRAANVEEGAALHREVDVLRLGGGSLSVAAPVVSPGTGVVVAAVELRTRPRPPAPGGSLPLALLAALAPALAMAAAARRIAGRWSAVALAAALVAAGMGAFHLHARAAVAGDLAAAQEGRGRAVEEAGRLARALLGAEAAGAPALAPAGWDTDAYGVSLPAGSAAALGHRLGVGPAAADRAAELAGGLALAVLLVVALGGLHRLAATVREHRQAYLYILPAVLGTLVLVFFPFFYGIGISFTDQNIYNSDRSLADLWIGLRNYADILSDVGVVHRAAGGGLAINYLSFYWTFLFTCFWTVTNVAWGVGMGLLLALTLNQRLAARPLYRILLIVPWATPNYITALVWKGMFHQQFGVVNQIVQLLGGQPVAWFDHPFTAFVTAWACNGWLSIPFNVVVTLGVLQSIPAELYEAARVDGASRWQQFKAITLPSLRPALVPEIILGVVWTFNMFNVIFLVTAGEPDSSTEILVTQSYKYAFERYRYGYAAAYSTIIFLILLAYGAFQNRVSRGTEAVT